MNAKFLRTLTLFLLVLAATAAHAQYPSRPIRLIVPIPAGGAPDIAARVGRFDAAAVNQAIRR